MSIATQIFEIVLDQATGSQKVGDLFWSEQPSTSTLPSMAFRYDREWVKTGFAIGGDLPLTESVQYPSTVTMNGRDGHFGFVTDHMPGNWLLRIVESAHHYGFKTISSASTPSQIRLWTLFRTHPQRFSALGIGASNRPTFHWLDLSAKLSNPRFAREADFYLECASDPRGPAKAADAEAILSLCPGVPGNSPTLAAPTLRAGPVEFIYGFGTVDASGATSVRALVMGELARRCTVDVLHGHPFGQRLYAEARCDRTENEQPLLILSAATLARPSPLPASFARPAFSYLDIADIINCEGSNPTTDLERLFKRVLFLRLIGIRESAQDVRFVRRENGWNLVALSAVSLSYVLGGQEPHTVIKATPEGDDIEDLLGSARYYGISSSRAKNLRLEFMRQLGSWKSVAQSLGADLMEISRMQTVFAKIK